MAYVELAAGLYLCGLPAFINDPGALTGRLIFRAFPVMFGAFLIADALSRLGWLL